MVRFEKDKPDPAEFKVGDKIMGYHFGLGAMMLVAGEVVEVEQPLSVFSQNSYEVKIIKEILDEDMKEGITLALKEDEATSFDEERIKKAIIHWKNEMRLRAESGKEHLLMLKELYPEDYVKIEETIANIVESRMENNEKKEEKK